MTPPTRPIASNLGALADVELLRAAPTPRYGTPVRISPNSSGAWGLEVVYGEHREVDLSAAPPLKPFLALARYQGDELARRVLLFARNHGPIDFCECGRPWPCVHAEVGAESGQRRFRSEIGKRAYDWHPVQWYADAAQLFRAILRLSARVARSHRGEPNDVVTFYRGFQRSIAEWELGWRCDPGALRNDLDLHVNTWLDNSRCTIQINWQRTSPTVQVGQPSPFSRLVYALALQIYAGGAPTAPCAGCGRMVTKQRQPKAGQRSWCRRDECLKAKDREAQRRRRDRLTAAAPSLE